MLGKSKIIAVTGLAAALLAGGWTVLPSALTTPVSALPASALEAGEGVVDGMTFAVDIGLEGKPPDIKDHLVFSDGMFVSIQCERLCQYPASAYFSRQTGDGTEFVSETRCPYKDAEIVWRGRIFGDRIEGVGTWTSRRWYWTMERRLAFAGELTESPAPLAELN